MALKNRRFLALSDEILMSVEKPARYTLFDEKIISD